MSQQTRPVAFITGASRGIGKACAVHLARAGFDVAVTARTLTEGEEREHSSTVKESNTKPLPGSLESTAALVEEAGTRALALPADLLDETSLCEAAKTVLGEWGRVDVLVQNGRYIGPGHMDRILETPIDLVEKHLRANVLAPVLLNQLFLPGMVERGSGAILHITSGAAYGNSPAPAGEGGWGLGYGISKGGFHRIAGFVAVEHAADGIFSCNIQPGMIQTERIQVDMGDFGFAGGAPPDVMGAVVAWVATHPEERARWNGETIEAQYFCHEHGLLPGWEGPDPVDPASVHADRAAEQLRQLVEARYRESQAAGEG